MMTPRQRQRWAKLRQRGRTRFIWARGVLRWGLTTALLWWLFMFCVDYWLVGDWSWLGLIIYLLIAVVVFPTAGFYWGSWTWTKNESKYDDRKTSD